MPFKNPHPLYMTWRSMRDRCLNPKMRSFHRYGGRGITICEEWDDFYTFVRDMGPKPSKLHSLDRKENNKGYYKENCKWSTRQEQQLNQERNWRVIIEGKEYLARQLHHEFGIKADTIVERANKGMTFSEVTAKTRYVYKGGPGRDGLAKIKAKKLAKTHCKRGHEWTEENTIRNPSQAGRLCRTCYNLRKGIKQ